MGEMRNAF